MRRHIKAGSYVSTCLHSGQAKSGACRNQGDGLSRGAGAVDIGMTSPQYEQLTVTYHLSGSMGSFTNDPRVATRIATELLTTAGRQASHIVGPSIQGLPTFGTIRRAIVDARYPRPVAADMV